MLAALLVAWSLAAVPVTAAAPRRGTVCVPILVYHQFGSAVRGEMTVSPSTLGWQLRYLKDHGYHVIWLRDYVRFRLGRAPPPPPHAVILTADDGRRSVVTDLLPLVRALRMPVTLFIYPSSISNAPYALTWAELSELIRTGLFQVQSHTYWHPNFHTEQRRLSPREYRLFVRRQLTDSKRLLEQRLGIHVELLAWPFGIYDRFLMRQAADAGYIAAVTLERRPAGPDEALLALPRYIVTEADVGARFAHLLASVASAAPAAAPCSRP